MSAHHRENILPKLPQSVALHIGAHKTASTHLQQVFDNNKDLLIEEGIRFYGPKFLRMRGRGLSAMFNMSWSETPPARRNAHEQLEFLAKGQKRLVFSEENFAGVLTNQDGRMPFMFYRFMPGKLEELAAAWAPIKPQIFLSVRNPASYMASVYSQSLFSAPHVGPRTFRARNDWRKVDWADYVAQIRATPGLGDIIVWRQEDYANNPRPVYRRMLRWRIGPKIETIDHLVHQGLSAPAVRLTLQRAVDGESGKIASEARQLLPVNEKNPPFKLYAASTLTAAEAIYEDQMAKISAMDGVQVLYQPKDEGAGSNKG